MTNLPRLTQRRAGTLERSGWLRGRVSFHGGAHLFPYYPVMSGNGSFNVRDFGAIGDGVALDSLAINATIDAAARAGGGTVVLPAGTYPSFSIRLRSNVALHLDAGAVLLAATPSAELGGYDAPEPNDWGDVHQYQDFGHSHWHNSLIWGEDLDNIAITGAGMIDGRGLVKNANYISGSSGTGPDGTTKSGERVTIGVGADVGPGRPAPPGIGNKAIALKRCIGVVLRDFTILNGGHFAVLATGVGNLAIESLRIDTNRDGLDIDGCCDVRISGCRVNTPNDDAIVLKTSYALGKLQSCEHVHIRDCVVSGYDVGTMLDGSFGRTTIESPDRDGPTGRIKLGTESNGAFRNISVANCVFERSRGIAIESVDGAIIEDVSFQNIEMRGVSSSPVFVRLGNRARGPEGTAVGAIRRVRISDVNATDSDGRFPILIAGLPGHPIEDVTLKNIRVTSQGGITMEQVAAQPPEMVNAFFQPGAGEARDPFAVPERERGYPEPSMFGLLPASAIYARHVRNLAIREMRFALEQPDTRPLVVLDDVAHASLEDFKAPHATGRSFELRGVGKVDAIRCDGLPPNDSGR